MHSLNRTVDSVRPYGLTVLRLTLGLVFLMHGIQKTFDWGFDNVAGAFTNMGIPLAYPSAVLVALLELVGGALLILGLGTRLVAAPLAVVMAVAIAAVHHVGFFAPQGVEFPLTLIAANVALVLAGPGALAMDNLIARRGGWLTATDRTATPARPLGARAATAA